MNQAPSRTLVREIASLRDDFVGYAESFLTLTVRRAHIAPAFLRTFKRWRAETGRTFVAFVHELDPSVPADRAEYPKHRSYQAALYLRRLAEAPQTQAKHRKTVTPFELAAMLIKGLLPLARGKHDEVWQGVAEACRWRGRDMQRLRNTVDRVRPVHLPGAPRLVLHRQQRRFATATTQHAVAADTHRTTA